ncbi:hypothetical protein POM88_033695 [Heracleum sosnowskyi]|uniref:Uncharacterized protein n=1 Tax=Heracleum sosnowskyi TaxID=360622 RepID=A0AAD8HJS6_9APIA|nr:hypothetical protein POM88_033695 [Heracleum sosnowskyi]
MRRFWRNDVVSQTDIDRLHPGWWDLVLTEFERYFAYDPDFATQENARDSIRHHMRNNDYVVKHKKEHSVLEHFKELHTLRENGSLISPETKEIMDRYEKLCADKNIDPSKTSLELWVKAVEGVRKNNILGYPRIRACDVLGTTRSARRVGEGGSGRSTMERLCDDLFMRAVDRTIAHAREHPEEFALSPDEVRLLARDLLDGEAELPQDHPLTEQTQRELIHVIIEVLNDMYKRNGPNKKC